MKAGKGVWHDGGPLEGDPLRVFQLWIALPEQEELAPPESQYIPADAVEEDGPVRVILGQYGVARSRIRAPEGINYFHVRLKDRERWVYSPPRDHNVAWLAVDRGRLIASETVESGEVAVFEESNGAIELRAEGATSFVLGSAIKHPHPLVLGYYSVHTSATALARGEAEIRRIGSRLTRDRPTLKSHQSSNSSFHRRNSMSTHSLADPQVPVSTNRTSASRAVQKCVGARRPTVSFGALSGFRTRQDHCLCGNGCLHVCAGRARCDASIGDRHRDRRRRCNHRRLEYPRRRISAGRLFAS